MKNPLLDKDFLYRLDHEHIREIFAKIISLDFSENPIEEIVGRVSQGSISIDGNSAVRRTCSLTLVANRNNGEDLPLHDYYWGLSQKIKIFIGVKNYIDDTYPDIIWFPQGVFLISQFNTNQTINSYNISIQGKDKISLLNGEIGGNITALSVDFGTEDIINKDGTVTNKKLLIKDIISEVVHEYAKEPYHNIIVNDLDDVGLELMEYRGTKPMYLIVDQNSNDVEQMILDEEFGLYDENGVFTKLFDITNLELFDHRIELNLGDNYAMPGLFYTAPADTLNPKTVIKCTYGDVIGYKITDIVYAGDLIGQVGNPVTSACLDKIVKMLGDYEYFYNLDGQFVFQRKKTHINLAFNNLRNSDSDFIPVSINQDEFDEGTYYIRNTPGQLANQESISLDLFSNNVLSLYSSQFVIADSYNPKVTYYKRVYIEGFSNNAVDNFESAYFFEDGSLITSFQNNPKLTEIKNDFSIWGVRESAAGGGAQLPVHMRYAIDKKPVYYKNYDGVIFITKDFKDDLELKREIKKTYDWRELIYQMAVDYSLYNHEDDFLSTIRKNNLFYYPTGYTGYEQYYTDIISFWRQLYDPNFEGCYEVAYCDNETFSANKSNFFWYERCRPEMEFQSDLNYYILDLVNGYVLRPTLRKEFYDLHPENYYILKQGKENSIFIENQTYYIRNENKYNEETYWSYDITESPELLNFWFDFLDTDGQFSQYSCHLIGNRPKAINDDNIKAIYFRETPTIILVDDTISDAEFKEQRQLKTGYVFFKVPSEAKNLFTVSGQGQSAKDKLEELLYKDACCTENVTISAIPIYYLEPNTRVSIRDDESGINGDYIVSKVSYNIGKGETMSVSGVKVIDRIY